MRENEKPISIFKTIIDGDVLDHLTDSIKKGIINERLKKYTLAIVYAEEDEDVYKALLGRAYVHYGDNK